MPDIHVLDSHVADLIAAGEVVERPASVAKELMENAVDAGASAVTVEISHGGMAFLRVTDNGKGIPADQMKTAFLRHATSKLNTEYDLEAIGTLGFRGEALAAISAVSRVEVLSRTADSELGASLSLEGGVPGIVEEAGCPLGTTMVVRDLFFNTPARLKFVKKDAAEGAAVFGIVQRVALSHPEVSVKFIRDGKQDLLTPGDGQLKSAVYAVLGRELALGFRPVKASGENNMEVTGFVSMPACCRASRNWQFFFVNGRQIKSRLLMAAVEEAYKNQKMVGKFPACVLHLETRLNSVDVNVHPAKTEVKFGNERQVFSAVYHAVLSTLDADHSHPAMELGEKQPKSSPKDQITRYQTKMNLSSGQTPGHVQVHDAAMHIDTFQNDAGNPAILSGLSHAGSGMNKHTFSKKVPDLKDSDHFSRLSAPVLDQYHVRRPVNVEVDDNDPEFAHTGPVGGAVIHKDSKHSTEVKPEKSAPAAVKQAEKPVEAKAKEPSAQKQPEQTAKVSTAAPEKVETSADSDEQKFSTESAVSVEKNQAVAGNTKSEAVSIDGPAPVESQTEPEVEIVVPPAEGADTEETPAWRVAGEVLNTYIIVEQGDTVYFIDKHAAHERMNFDRMKAQGYDPMAQTLLTPVVCRLSAPEMEILLDHHDLLSEFGFDLDELGGQLAVRQAPFDVEVGDIEATLTEIAQKLLTTGSADPSAARDDLLHTMACKAAIKGGWKTSQVELERVAKSVMDGDVKYCPHGRPVAVELTRHELEKQFKRIV